MHNLMKRLNGTKDLTNGKPLSLILAFGIPLLLGVLFQQFYNMVDSIIVGQTLGVNALAAVGSTGSINFMIVGFCIGVCNGFGIPIAQSFGAKDFVNLRKFITHCVYLSAIFAVILTTAVGLLTRQILLWMRTPESLVDMAYIYIFIVFMGIPAIYLYNMVSAILRSLGNSITPLLFLIFSSVLNIVLDLILVPRLGVAGAGVATISSQATAGVISLFYMLRKYQFLEIKALDWKPSGRHLKTLCSMGVPMGLQYSITAIGSVILQSAVNCLGEIAVAAMSAGSKISIFAICPLDAMGSTMATYGGQNVGAGRLDRVDRGMKDCIKLGVVYAILAFVVMLFFGKYMALLFVDESETLMIHYVYIFLVANSGAYILLALVNIIRFMIQGLGYSTFAILAGVCEMLARGLAGFLLVPMFGFTGAIFASPLAWVFADAFLIPAYLYVMKRLRVKLGVKAESQEAAKQS